MPNTPWDQGTDYTAVGNLRRWGAFTDGLKHNVRGRRRAARMALGLLVAVVAVGAVVWRLVS